MKSDETTRYCNGPTEYRLVSLESAAEWAEIASIKFNQLKCRRGSACSQRDDISSFIPLTSLDYWFGRVTMTGLGQGCHLSI
jgi:hypothetical protein